MRKKMISLMMTVAMGTVMISGATVVKADSDEKETVKLAVWSSGCLLYTSTKMAKLTS